MNIKNFLIVSALALPIIGSGLFFSGTGSEKQTLTAQEVVKNYLIDNKQHIRLEETSLARAISPPPKTSSENITSDNELTEEAINVADEPDSDIANDISGDLPEHNMAEYFRYLQTDLAEGNTPSQRTESIREHLLATLPSDKAGELIDLYEKFTNFESDVVTKAEEWSMPESADDTLELIGAMQQYQHEYFGEDHANLLFGADMKVMEYNARRAIIINDKYTSGQDKEQLLDQLGIGMWGEDAYQAMNANKDPYDILDEKLLIYGNELAAIDPATREEEIKKLRARYLPPGY